MLGVVVSTWELKRRKSCLEQSTKPPTKKEKLLLFWWKIVMRPRNVGKFERILGWKAEGWSNQDFSAWPNWEMVPVLFYTGHNLGFPLELLHPIPITCRAKSNGMEKALGDSDPKSPQNGAAAQHWSHSKATLPSLGEAWRGKISL